MKIFAITLFAANMPDVVAFYEAVFSKKPIQTDDTSALFQFDSMYVNVILESEARTLVSPQQVAETSAGFSNLLTIQVEDVDAEALRLESLGIKLVNGPLDQPWGIRALIFEDPTSQAWEFSQPLESK